MKSALELAMEKADDMVDKDEEHITLAPEQLKAIGQIKNEYQA